MLSLMKRRWQCCSGGSQEEQPRVRDDDNKNRSEPTLWHTDTAPDGQPHRPYHFEVSAAHCLLGRLDACDLHGRDERVSHPITSLLGKGFNVRIETVTGHALQVDGCLQAPSLIRFKQILWII